MESLVSFAFEMDESWFDLVYGGSIEVLYSIFAAGFLFLSNGVIYVL